MGLKGFLASLLAQGTENTLALKVNFLVPIWGKPEGQAKYSVQVPH